MTLEKKQLLLKDLCARLPYCVKVNHFDVIRELLDIIPSSEIVMVGYDINDYEDSVIEDIKPYLRSMSSMTNEEGRELEHIFSEIDVPCWVDTQYGCVNFAGNNDFIDAEIAEVYTDWLNKKMFDYRGLIEKGLALEAPEGMYKTE